MFQNGEIVLYKTFLCKVLGVQEENAKKVYVLESLEDDPWIIRVPYANTYAHIHALPSQQELQDTLQKILEEDTMVISSNAIDKCCQPLCNSCLIEDWLKLAKAAIHDKLQCEATKHKFHYKEKAYLEKIMEPLTAVFAMVYQINTQEANQMIVTMMAQKN